MQIGFGADNSSFVVDRSRLVDDDVVMFLGDLRYLQEISDDVGFAFKGERHRPVVVFRAAVDECFVERCFDHTPSRTSFTIICCGSKPFNLDGVVVKFSHYFVGVQEELS